MRKAFRIVNCDQYFFLMLKFNWIHFFLNTKTKLYCCDLKNLFLWDCCFDFTRVYYKYICSFYLISLLQWFQCVCETCEFCESYSQSEDFVPLWVEVFVDSVCLQPIVTQLHHTERVTLTFRAKKTNIRMTFVLKRDTYIKKILHFS